MDGIVSFGYWVRRRRKAMDLTQSTLAQRVGCSVFTVRKIERDERRPSLQIAGLLADQLNIPEEERDNFLRMARGEFVASMASPIEAVSLPDFLQKNNVPSTQEETPFVARKAELAQLNSFLDLALSGQGRVVFVTGEAGRGKTALVQEFTRRALEKETALVAAKGNCNAYSGVGDPYLPFREILGLLTGDVEAGMMAGSITHTQAQRLWNLRPYTIQSLVKTGSDLIDTIISGSDLVVRSTVEASGGASWQIQLEEVVARKVAERGPVDLKQNDLFEQYVKVMLTLARQKPLLLVLDDLQWADAGSINLLFHLGRRLQGNQILIVGVYRPVEVAMGRDGERHPLEPLVSEFQRHFGQIQIDLRLAEGRQFVADLLDTEPNRLGETFQEAFYKHTQGHALFAVEMLRGLQERGDLVQDAAGQWVEGAALDWETLPARVEGVIGDRITRLPPMLREMLEVASVEGEIFTAEVIARAQAVDEREMIRQLSGDLDKRHRLIVGQGSQRLGTRRLSQYRFRHILFQHYLYNTLDKAERGYLHEAVAKELEQLYGEQAGDIAGELARHFEAAGLFDKAVFYSRQAGDRAVRLSANEEALVHFYKGLALLETMPDTLERQRQELTLQIALIAPLIAAKGYGAPELGQTYARAQELGEQVGEPGQIFLVLYGLWGYGFVRGDMKTARELAKQCLTLAENIQEPALLMEGHRMTDETAFHRGELVAAREHLERTLSLYDPQLHSAHATVYGQDPGVASYSHGSWILWHLGYPDQARKMGQQAVALGEDVSHPFSLDFALCYNAVLHQFCREGQRVEELTEAAIRLSTEQGFVAWLAIATILRGWVLAKRGQVGEGIAQMRQGLADNKAIHINLHLPYQLALLAEVYGEVGQPAEGLTSLVEAMTLVDKGEVRHWEAELYRLKVELLLKDKGGSQKARPERGSKATGGRRDEPSPESYFLQAIEIARRQSAKSLELRAVMSLSQLWQAQGKKEEARQMLAEVYGWFTEGFDTLDLKDASALLEELS